MESCGRQTSISSKRIAAAGPRFHTLLLDLVWIRVGLGLASTAVAYLFFHHHIALKIFQVDKYALWFSDLHFCLSLVYYA
jgi:hypothetical protein